MPVFDTDFLQLYLGWIGLQPLNAITGLESHIFDQYIWRHHTYSISSLPSDTVLRPAGGRWHTTKWKSHIRSVLTPIMLKSVIHSHFPKLQLYWVDFGLCERLPNLSFRLSETDLTANGIHLRLHRPYRWLVPVLHLFERIAGCRQHICIKHALEKFGFNIAPRSVSPCGVCRWPALALERFMSYFTISDKSLAQWSTILMSLPSIESLSDTLLMYAMFQEVSDSMFG